MLLEREQASGASTGAEALTTNPGGLLDLGIDHLCAVGAYSPREQNVSHENGPRAFGRFLCNWGHPRLTFLLPSRPSRAGS